MLDWLTQFIGNSPTQTNNPPAGGGGFNWGSINNILGDINKVLKGESSAGQAGQMLGTAGLGWLLNRMFRDDSDLPGYGGSVPLYTATRQQLPIPTATSLPEGVVGPAPQRRPGQGGITYFSPIQYTHTGVDPRTPQQFLNPPTPPAAPPAEPPPPVLPGGESGNVHPNSANPNFAEGGLAALSSRFVQGPGDGTSDSIPVRMQDGREGRLADGEFVFDARTVSEIGNGSSVAGARKLQQMVDRIHAHRTRAQRGKPSGADQHLTRSL